MRFLSMFLFILLMSAMSSCTSSYEQSTLNGNVRTLRYALSVDPATFDPHITDVAEAGAVLRHVYDTLVYRDPVTGDFVPGLATEWTVSDDGLNYTFRLKQGVVFHDGTEFNSTAVAFNLDRIVNPETGSRKAIDLLGPYSRYEIIDDYTIQINLSEPFSPLLDGFSQFYLGMASPQAITSYSNLRYQFHQIGTGPYKLTDFIPGTHAILERNDAYTWGPLFYDQTILNPIERVEYRFVTDPQQRARMVQSGEIDLASRLLPIDARDLSVNASVQILPGIIPGQPMQFLVNVQEFPTDNTLVRQALLYGMNRTEILDSVYQGFGNVAWGPLSSRTLFYSREMPGIYDYDLLEAQNLLEVAGFEDTNNDGYREIGGVNLEIRLLLPPDPLLLSIAEKLRDQWQIIGIRLIIQSEPTIKALEESVSGSSYNLVAFNSFGVDPSFLSDYFASEGENNWSNFEDSTLDQTLETAILERDPVIRASAYVLAQRSIMNNALIIPIVDHVNLLVASSSLTNLQYDVYGWYPLIYKISWQDS